MRQTPPTANETACCLAGTSAMTSMDVDEPVDTQTEMEKKVILHPLAIVNMSDQFTRITGGGSPLKPTDPVVGLLFGTLLMSGSNKQLQTTNILGSDDISLVDHEAAAQQIGLHQAVFSTHEVLGWYAVGNREPNMQDVTITKELGERHGRACLFCHLQVAPQSTQDEENDLPLTVYQLSSDKTSLLAIEDWTMQTDESERIALEHVVRQQPRDRKRSPGEQDSKYCDAVHDIQDSLGEIHERVATIVSYLMAVEEGNVSADPALMRQIQSLLWQLGPLRDVPSPPHSQSTQHLAALVRAVDSSLSFGDKFRAVNYRRPRGMDSGRRSVFDA